MADPTDQADLRLSFLRGYSWPMVGTASITILLPDTTVARIDRVSPTVVSKKCPLLGFAFEDGVEGSHASLEASSENAVVCLLRYLYTDDYIPQEHQETSTACLLIHAEVYKLARDFDVPELQVAAYCNFSRETEMSCSLPTPLTDLCDTIRFVYKHLENEQSLIDTLLHYCVSVFGYHRLGSNQDFRQAAFDNPKFHQALCETNCKRDFQDDGASDIVCLSSCRAFDRPTALFDMDSRTQAEFQFEEWYDSETLNAHIGTKEDSPSTKRRKTDAGDAIPLVYRSRPTDTNTSSSEENSDLEEFVLVHRPCITSTLEETRATDDTPSSLEVLSGPYLEVDSDSVSDSSDDEQWTPWDDTPKQGRSDDEWSLL